MGARHQSYHAFGLPLSPRSLGSPRLAALLVAAAIGGGICAPTTASAEGIFSEAWTRYRGPGAVVHTHEGTDPIGAEVAAMCEAATAEIARVLGWTWARTDVVLEDRTDSANGVASVVPFLSVRLHAVSPNADSALGYHDNYMWNLVVHELVHIAHLGRVGGLPGLSNRIFDTEFAPNQAVPRWLSEGLATWFESELTGTGRLHSAYFDGVWRARALAGRFPDMGELAGDPVEWPYATGWYLYGAHFVDWMIDRHGIEGVARFIEVYGRQVVPFRINEVARETIGAGFTDEWPAYRASMEGRAWGHAVAARAFGLPEPTRLTEGGHQTRFAAIAPDGALAWLSDDGDRAQAIVLRRDAGTRRVRLQSGGEFDFIDDATVVIDQPHAVDRVYAFRDLFAIDLRSGEQRALTHGARAREPRVSPDGASVVFAAHDTSRTDLRRVDLRSGEVSTVFRAAQWAQATSPVFAPDGSVVFAYQAPGEGRDLYRVSGAGELERLTWDRASATDPFVTPDGRFVLFSSDRSGTHDIYALELSSGTLTALTRSPSGAFSPVLDRSGRLIFSVVGPDGYDLWTLEPGPLDAAGLHAGPATNAMRPRPIPEVSAPIERRTGPPIASLRGPDGAIRIGLGSITSQVGMRLRGNDAPGANAYDLVVHWSFDHMQPIGSLAWANRRLPAELSASVTRTLVERPERLVAESRYVPFVEEQYSGVLGTSASFPDLGSRHVLSASYGANHYGYLREPAVVHDPVDIAPREPRFVRFNALVVGWSWSDVEAYPESFTTPSGTAIGSSLRVRSPALGAEVESADVTASVTHYAALPWARHVVAVRAAGGIAESRGVARREFSLGGPSTQDLFLALRDGLPAGAGDIRGFRPGVRQGNRFYRGQVEYRFPLVSLAWGAGTLPVYLGRLHGAVFFDTGQATDDRVRGEDALYGVGGELRLGSTIGYAESAPLRAGVARGLGPDGIWDVYMLYGWEF